ncbi:MAG: bifunctional UDP-N-acetylglucosamine diphosphorylase/glucosamine-1-phosphate N-acetyltransferase GlmU [Acidimicrobiia bacterium]
MTVRAIVLAAGKGTRMKSDRSKVAHDVAGRPIISWVVDAVGDGGADEVTVVVGHGAEDVAAALPEGVAVVVQEEQLGTAHAATTALTAIGDVSGDTILVVPGDSPLLRAGTFRALLEAHAGGDARCTLLTAVVPDPTGYGRVIRVGDRVRAIVEDRDADEAQRAINEIAVSTYVFDGDGLVDTLAAIENRNDQGEYYLTDAVAAMAPGGGVAAMAGADAEEVQGVNSHDQLAAADEAMRRRINLEWMEAGVWMKDPSSVYIGAEVTLEAGVRLYPGTHLEGGTSVGADSEIGPNTIVRDSTVGPGSRIWFSVVREVEIAAGVEVGPYASLRSGTVMADGSKAGTFVELKAATVGKGSKVPHLSYIGDAAIGEGSNVGAGTITCNYDGFAKHRTVIGDRVFIGSDTMLVAPVEIGDDAYTGAGSVITKDVAPGALAVERSPQKELAGYAERRARLAESEGE